ncbi:fibronectin type III domain-containing protein 1-like [Centroberyx affinis]|uniref:fibronectin type III domain-containing protein 1-like n=1 Tax=Centroberyx affinis TaxID=166261 RepID=UPI003A5C248B
MSEVQSCAALHLSSSSSSLSSFSSPLPIPPILPSPPPAPPHLSSSSSPWSHGDELRPQPQVTSSHLLSPHLLPQTQTLPPNPQPQHLLLHPQHLHPQPQHLVPQYQPQHLLPQHLLPQSHPQHLLPQSQPQHLLLHPQHLLPQSQPQPQGLDDPDKEDQTRSEPPYEPPCLLNSHSYSYQSQETNQLDLHHQNQFSAGWTPHRHQLENTHLITHTPAYDAHTLQPEVTHPQRNHTHLITHTPAYDAHTLQPEVTHPQRNHTHLFSHSDTHTLPSSGVYGPSHTHNAYPVTHTPSHTHPELTHTHPELNAHGPPEPTLSQLQCSPLGCGSGGVSLAGWSSMEAASSSILDFSSPQFYPNSYPNYPPQAFCTPQTPSPHYPPPPPANSSPSPEMDPSADRLGFDAQIFMQLKGDKTHFSLTEPDWYPMTSDPSRHPLQAYYPPFPSQVGSILDRTGLLLDAGSSGFFQETGQEKGQDVGSPAQLPGLAAGQNWREECGGGRGGGGRGGRRGGGGGGRRRGGAGGGEKRGGRPEFQVLLSTSQHQSQIKLPQHEESSEASDCRLVCMVCQRDFKSLPALNGHMRSHGGFRSTTHTPRRGKGEDSSAPVRPSVSMTMPVLCSAPPPPSGQERGGGGEEGGGVAKAWRGGKRRSSRPLFLPSGGAVLFCSLMRLTTTEEEKEAVAVGDMVAGNSGAVAMSDRVDARRDGAVANGNGHLGACDAEEEEAVAMGDMVARNDDTRRDGAVADGDEGAVARGNGGGGRGCEAVYTPPPMLCPVRPGAGLYCRLLPAAPLQHAHNGVDDLVSMVTGKQRVGIKVQINVGRGFQAEIPPPQDRRHAHSDSHNALLLWMPMDELESPVNQQRVEALLMMARSSVLPGGGASPEHALHVLSECRGDFLAAVDTLLSGPDSCSRPPHNHYTEVQL